MSIRIILADDHVLVREGLRALLEERAEMQIVGEAANGQRALELVRQEEPDVVTMEVAMPLLNGIDATRMIVAEFPRVKVLAVTRHSERHFVDAMLRAGAAGYICKRCPSTVLIEAIKNVVVGRGYLCPTVAAIAVKSYTDQSTDTNSSCFLTLSGRERQVLQLIAEGKTSKDTARRLFIAVRTVDAHRQRIMDKLNLHSVAGLTRYAIREGVSPLEV